MAQIRTWSITTNGKRPLADIARDLEQQGFLRVQVLEELGVLTGDAAEDQMDACRAVAGVKSIEPEPTIDIGPPGSKITY